MLGVSVLSGFGVGGGRTFDVVLTANTTNYANNHKKNHQPETPD